MQNEIIDHNKQLKCVLVQCKRLLSLYYVYQSLICIDVYYWFSDIGWTSSGNRLVYRQASEVGMLLCVALVNWNCRSRFTRMSSEVVSQSDTSLLSSFGIYSLGLVAIIQSTRLVMNDLFALATYQDKVASMRLSSQRDTIEALSYFSASFFWHLFLVMLAIGMALSSHRIGAAIMKKDKNYL